MRKHILMAASAALGFAAAPVTQAAAQTRSSYCEGRLQASTFYSTNGAAGSTQTTTSFWVLLQNTTRNEVNFAVNFLAPQLTNRPNGTVFTKLGQFGTSQPVLLGRQTTYSHMQSQVLPLSALPENTRVTCR